MKKLMLSCVVMLTFSCTVPERYVIYKSQGQQKESKQQYQETMDKTESGGIRFKGGDGSSMESAIIICGAKNEIEADPAEIAYISKRHGERDKSWKMTMQSNFKTNERIYVEYQIKDLATGASGAYFFDNTSLYSTFLKDTGAPVTQKQQKDTQPIFQPAGEITENTENNRVRYTGGDGSSMESAIIIYGAKNEDELIQAEMDYISQRHGEREKTWKMVQQNDFRRNGRSYVEYEIEDFKKGGKTAYFFENTPLNSSFLERPGTPPAMEQPQKAYQTAAEKIENNRVRYKGGDGSSMESAIILFGPENGKEVLRAEIDYISKKHGGKDRFWKIILQGNYRRNYRQYDEISIKETNSGERFDYFFDVSEVSGK